jgi:hypothetical protein
MLTNPVTAHPKPPFPRQSQPSPPGLQAFAREGAGETHTLGTHQQPRHPTL